MSRSLQHSIRALKQEEVNDSNLSHFCGKITEITQDKLEDLPFESVQSLVEICSRVKKFIPYSEKIRAYKNKETLKNLSDEITSYVCQINTYYPIDCTNDSNLDGLSYHELEEMANRNQKDIERVIKQIERKKVVITAKSGFLYHHLKIVMGKAEFKLMLFDYLHGIPAFFPHEDKVIEKQKSVLEAEVNETLEFLTQKYGKKSVEKIIETRKKWDLDYALAYESLQSTLKNTEKFNSEVLDDTVILHKNYIIDTKISEVFIQKPSQLHFNEGAIEHTVAFQLVDMERCRIKTVNKSFSYYEGSSIEIVNDSIAGNNKLL